MLPHKSVVEAPQAGMGTTAPAVKAQPVTAAKPTVTVEGTHVVPPETKIFTFVKATHPGERLLIDGQLFTFPFSKLNNGGYSTAATLRTSDEVFAAKIRAYAAAHPAANITEQ